MHKSYRDPNDRGNSFGNILTDTVRYNRLKPHLVRMLGAHCTDREIVKELAITQDTLDVYKQKLKREKIKVALHTSVPAEDLRHEVSLEQFLAHVQEDVDIVAWSSYYHLLKFAGPELDHTKHVKDKSGVMLERTDLKRLVRIAFTRLYPKQVVDEIKDQKLMPVAIKTQREDAKSFASKGYKVRNVVVEIQEHVFRSIVQIYFDCLRYEEQQVACSFVNVKGV